MRNNKYKSIVNGLFMGLALTALVGCNDYLDIEPQSEISPENISIQPTNYKRM